MKSCGLHWPHSRSSPEFKDLESLQTSASCSNVVECPEWQLKSKDNKPCFETSESNTLNKARKIKMPGFLRLNSVGEDSSSSELFDGNNRPQSTSVIKSGTQMLSSAHAATLSPSKIQQIKPAPLGSPARMTLNFLSPVCTSTPFHKSESFPGNFTEMPKRTVRCSNYPTPTLKNNLFLNKSVPLPQSESSLQKGKLETSLSTPSILPKSFQPVPTLVKHLCCPTMNSKSLGESKDFSPSANNVRALNTSSESMFLNEANDSFQSDTDVENSTSPVESEDNNKSEAPLNNSEDVKKTPDRTFVLFQRRKCTKKGRPSSKKQKKRMREKLKQSDVTADNNNEQSLIFSISVNDVSDESSSQNFKVHLACGQDTTNFQENDQMSAGRPNADSSEVTFSTDIIEDSNASPSINPTVRPELSSLACIFISGSDSEQSSGTCSDEDDWDSLSEEEDGDENDCANAMESYLGFGVALSLDAIFKKKDVPSLDSVMQGNEKDFSCSFSPSSPNGFTVVWGSGSSEEDGGVNSPSMTSSNLQDLSSSPVDKKMPDPFNDFNPGLCLDSILSRVSLKSPRPSSQPQSSVANVSDVVPQENHLPEINAKWDEHYDTASFRSCCYPSSIISHPTVKVRFVDDGSLETVHEVGTEDRRGDWQNFALDRERFNRRIQEVEGVLSPVLDSAHREKILKRNDSNIGNCSVDSVS